MAKRNLATILCWLIHDDWEHVWIVYGETERGLTVTVQTMNFMWHGELTQVEWHQLMQRGTNALGHVPNVQERRPAAARAVS